jgi:hypothetical protein
MKQVLSLSIFFCLCAIHLSAQELHQKHFVTFNTTLHNIHNEKFKGYIATMDDSTLYLSKTVFALTFEDIDLKKFEKFGYSEINKVYLLRKNSVGSGLWIGSIAGLVVGTITGLSMEVRGQNFAGLTQLSNGILGALLGAGIGCIVGAGIGALSGRNFSVKGNKDKFQKMKETMIDRLYTDGGYH